MPGGWVVESSYVGRFARDLVGQVDIASAPNVRDPVSGMTFYEATDQLFTRYLNKGVPPSGVQPIAWYENVYPEIKSFVEGRLNTTFASATQAWYAYLLQQTATGPSLTPGPNAPVSLYDRINAVEALRSQRQEDFINGLGHACDTWEEFRQASSVITCERL